jgi:hypothetical protein
VSQIPDEKLQAVVSLVVQAVDQRLNTVREQLVQLAKSVARNQSELQKQIDQCRMMCEIATSAPVQGRPDPQNEVAAQQLLQVATTLAEQVGSFEARVNHYTNQRFAELAARLDSAAPSGERPLPVVHSSAVPVTQSGPVPVVQSHLPDLPAALSRLAPLAASPTTGSIAVTSASAPAAIAAPVVPVTPWVGAAAPPMSTGDADLDALTRQMSERLSAAIEKALGV